MSTYAMGNAAAGTACSGTITVSKRVWVPNVKTENVPVTTSTTQSHVVNYTVFEQQSEQVPYECTRIVYYPETRTGTKKTVVYVDETRTRNRKVVQYQTETRTRLRKELTFKTVTKEETIPYVSYKSEKKTKEVTYTFHVPEYSLEPYETTRYDRVAGRRDRRVHGRRALHRRCGKEGASMSHGATVGGGVGGAVLRLPEPQRDRRLGHGTIDPSRSGCSVVTNGWTAGRTRDRWSLLRLRSRRSRGSPLSRMRTIDRSTLRLLSNDRSIIVARLSEPLAF